MIAVFRSSLSLIAAFSSLFLGGCIAPAYPYNGSVPYGAVAPGGIPPQPVAVPAPYVASPPPVMIAPVFYPGWGTGYWYRGGYWPSRYGYGFYNGRYYRGNYWHGRYRWR
jgi:hypothetical protein